MTAETGVSVGLPATSKKTAVKRPAASLMSLSDVFVSVTRGRNENKEEAA